MSVRLAVCVVLSWTAFALGDPPAVEPSAERGRVAVSTLASPLTSTTGSWETIWRAWGLDERPADFDARARERYGLLPATEKDADLPGGLVRMDGPFGTTSLGNNCLLCHAGRIAGRTVVGLGNASLDLQSLHEDLRSREFVPIRLPFRLANGRGIVEASAGTIYLLRYRDAELDLVPPRDLALPDSLCEDVPAWWNLRRKRTMFHTGAVDTRSVRSNLAFFLAPLNDGETVKSHARDVADVREYLLTLEPPAYPFSIDRALAARGESVFVENCSRCHGTYGEGGEYPNVVVPVDEVGTDPALATFDGGDHDFYEENWMFRERGPDGEPYHLLNHGGYQAPPLDGVWATAPYLHNGSVPTLAGVLDSGSRPRVFTRSFGTEREDYDPRRVGWRVEPVSPSTAARARGHERRRITDTTQPGRGNGGHRFGDELTPTERRSVLEYLKTL